MGEHAFGVITLGMRVNREYEIPTIAYSHFLEAFHDMSPIHVDEEYAKAQGFRGKVMHGAILNGFISHFVGMHFPGKYAMLQSVDIQYKNPSYLGDTIKIEAEVVQKVEALRVIVLKMSLMNLTQGVLAAAAKVQVGMFK